MKILIDLTSLDDNFSGIERYALNISKQMIIQDDKNNYILVFKNNIHEEFKKFRNRKNVKFKIIKGKNKLIFNQLILPYYLYKFKCDKYLFLAFPSPILFKKRGIIYNGKRKNDCKRNFKPNTKNIKYSRTLLRTR